MAKYFYRAGCKFTLSKGSIYCLEPMFIDIETSNNHAEKPEDLRTWISSIQVLFKNEYHLFRYPEELIAYLKSIYKKLNLKPTEKFKKKLVIYVHNLSYDISYLYPYLLELPDNGDKYQGIIEDNNKFLTFVRGSFEFRCSYRLSGLSLEKWSQNNTKYKKKVGFYDYNKIIYPDQELNESEELYDRMDVYSMKEALFRQMSYFNDDITTIPLTKTGYIRRTLRRSCRNDKYYRKKYFWDNRLNPICYEYCLKSFAGGYTHNNRHWRDILIKTGETYEYIKGSGINIKVDRIRHGDFKSHYPTQQACSDRFPTGKPQHIYDNTMHYALSIEDILSEKDFTYFIKMRIVSAHLRTEFISMPFMQKSKCYQLQAEKMICDNGRIIFFEGEFITYLDSITLGILAEQYEIEYEILDCYRMKNSRLPDCIVSVVDKYFKGKSDKKNIVHELTEAFGKLDPKTIAAEEDLMYEKSGLNSIYGCCVMQPLKTELQIDELMKFSPAKTYITEEEVEAGLEKYYTNKNSFLAYQVGCVVTSLSREELFRFIKVIGYDRCLYCDTDSIFYISDEETENRIEALNKELRKEAHSVVLDNGDIEYYNEFTAEPDCLAFKGLHSKCYGVVTNKGLEITIAGVPARTMIGMNLNNEPFYITREQELSEINKGVILPPIKALDHLSDNFEFKINTGICALYIGALGYETERKPQIIEIDGHEIHTAGGCVLKKLEAKRIVLDPENKTNKKNYEENINPESIK